MEQILCAMECKIISLCETVLNYVEVHQTVLNCAQVIYFGHFAQV